MERIAVLADIHGNLPALGVVVADIKHRGITNVVNLGDHVSGPLWPAATLTFLMQQPWTHIAGNHDRHLVQQDPALHSASNHYAFAQLDPAQLDWLRTLPATRHLPPELLLCHGTPTDDEQYLLETIAQGGVRLATSQEIEQRLAGTQAAVILCAHTHIPRVVHWNGQLIVNPGSVGSPAYMDETPEPHIVATGSPVTRYAVLEAHPDGWRVELIALPYDHEQAAQQAQANNRPDWAMALATGFLNRTSL